MPYATVFNCWCFMPNAAWSSGEIVESKDLLRGPREKLVWCVQSGSNSRSSAFRIRSFTSRCNFRSWARTTWQEELRGRHIWLTGALMIGDEIFSVPYSLYLATFNFHTLSYVYRLTSYFGTAPGLFRFIPELFGIVIQLTYWDLICIDSKHGPS